jgi:hypothetical protein
VSAQPWVVGELARTQLDETSWVDVGRGWLRDPDEVYAALADAVPWRQAALWRYDHPRLEHRLSASCRPTLSGPHPAVLETPRPCAASTASSSAASACPGTATAGTRSAPTATATSGGATTPSSRC